MNPIHRKARNLEMTNTHDHSDVPGGLSRHVRRPRLLIYAAVVAVIAAVPVTSSSAARGPVLGKPTGLQTFDLRLDDSPRPTSSTAPEFSRTPAFAWKPVQAGHPLRVRAFDEQRLRR